MKVSVYRNLTKGCYSIRACEGPLKGRVIAHATDVSLIAVGFHVGAFGQRAVRRTGHKNVHAFVTGTLIGYKGTQRYPEAPAPYFDGDATVITNVTRMMGEPFTYNPYLHDGFVSKMDGRIVCQANSATLSITHGNYARITSSQPAPSALAA
jgi:hypothetical protein